MALGITYFLDVEVWEKYGFIQGNIDNLKLNPIIDRVQRNRVEPVLGTKLYEKLQDDVAGTGPTGLYKELLDKYVIPMMIAYCDWKYTKHGTSQMTNKTVGRNNDEHITANTTDQNNNLRDEFIKDAKQSERKCIGWLQDNKDDIPEYKDTDADKCHQSIFPSKGESNYGNTIGVV